MAIPFGKSYDIGCAGFMDSICFKNLFLVFMLTYHIYIILRVFKNSQHNKDDVVYGFMYLHRLLVLQPLQQT